MRLFAICAGCFFFIGGVTAMVDPHEMVVGHGGMGTRFFMVWRSRLETISKDGCIAYGAAATAIGSVLIYCGVMGGPRSWRRDAELAHCIPQVSAELMKRYGRIEDCTEAQIEATARMMKVSADLTPYLFAAFMGRKDLAQSEKRSPGVDWPAVEACVERLFDDLPQGDLRRSHYHASWAETEDVSAKSS
jgi:hypothetical protein